MKARIEQGRNPRAVQGPKSTVESPVHRTRGLRPSTFDPPRLARGKGRAGFALMDLMVSVLILGLFLVPLAISRNNIILMAGDTVSLRKARILAVQKLGELELTVPEELSDGSGDFGEEHPGFFWETKVETVLIEDVLDLGSTEEEEEGAFSDPEEEEEEVPAYELVRLTLVVRARRGEATTEEPADEWGEEKKMRAGDRVHIVRYFLKKPEPEVGLGE